MELIISEMKTAVLRLETQRLEKRFDDMPYLLGRLLGYNDLLQEILDKKLREPKEVTDERSQSNS